MLITYMKKYMKDSLGVYQYDDDKYLPEFKNQIRNKEKFNDKS